MNETEQNLLERAIKAETQASFLYETLKKIEDKCHCCGYHNVREIAQATIKGYENTQKKK